MPAFAAPYVSFSAYLKQRFGQAVAKISLDVGFTCRNRDGTLSSRGCIFCQPRSFAPAAGRGPVDLPSQLAAGIARGQKRGVNLFMAYFQAHTNTYAPLDRLQRAYDSVRAFPQIKALAVGTRPDCLGDPVLELLAGYIPDYEVWLEIGLQTIHDRTLRLLDRGHSAQDFIAAVARARTYPGLKICAHVILGLPEEDEDDELTTAAELARLRLDGIKLHPFYIAKDTPAADAHARGRFQVLEQEAYVRRAVGFLEHVWPHTIIERLTADCPAQWLVAPAWLADKPAVLRAVRAEFQNRSSWQGKHSA